MTGPFVRVQESRLYGPTWVNVARIVKIQRTSNGTAIFVEGAGTMQTEEPAEELIGRLEAALAGRVTMPRRGALRAKGAPRGLGKVAEIEHG
jgi:hypothetical protein